MAAKKVVHRLIHSPCCVEIDIFITITGHQAKEDGDEQKRRMVGCCTVEP
jgi:hypothetical protein